MLEGIGITKRFDKHAVLSDINLTVEPGKITVVVGPSGGGKSTLLRAMSLLEPPDSGEIRIDGEIHRFPAKGSRMAGHPWPKLGVVFQQLFLWPHLTLRQNVLLPLQLRGKGATLERVQHLIDVFGLTTSIDRYPNETSLGQRQRAALIRALALEPRYLLLDEITSALDVEHVVRVVNELREARANGMGIMLITHLIGFAKSSADHVVFMESGKVIESDGASILSSPKTKRLAAFLSLLQTAA
jgi:ABC-type polar amino acid transport system ATPase subunit